jgi:hypothetical protein
VAPVIGTAIWYTDFARMQPFFVAEQTNEKVLPARTFDSGRLKAYLLAKWEQVTG